MLKAAANGIRTTDNRQMTTDSFSSLFLSRPVFGDPLHEGERDSAEEQDVYEAALAEQQTHQPHEQQNDH
jgi:hypothetical protein